jgi:ribosomal protein S18 acetylase RimI-like enzyme
VNVRPLADDEVALVDAHLPLHRLDQFRRGKSCYLVAWNEETPIGHAHLAWPSPELKEPSLPELQDVYVVSERRREGIATVLAEAAEHEAKAKGFAQLMLSFGTDNEAARLLYERAGYRDAGLDPVRMTGTILIRGKPMEVDDTLVYLVKSLA